MKKVKMLIVGVLVLVSIGIPVALLGSEAKNATVETKPTIKKEAKKEVKKATATPKTKEVKKDKKVDKVKKTKETTESVVVAEAPIQEIQVEEVTTEEAYVQPEAQVEPNEVVSPNTEYKVENIVEENNTVVAENVVEPEQATEEVVVTAISKPVAPKEISLDDAFAIVNGIMSISTSESENMGIDMGDFYLIEVRQKAPKGQGMSNYIETFHVHKVTGEAVKVA